MRSHASIHLKLETNKVQYINRNIYSTTLQSFLFENDLNNGECVRVCVCVPLRNKPDMQASYT